MDEALDRLRQIINDNMYDEDHETGDYDYDSYDAQDSEIESDNTDYDAILEEILEE